MTTKRLAVAIVRNWDLEARELLMFDRLTEDGTIDATAFGQDPATAYGTAGVRIPIERVRSTAGFLERLPLGSTMSRLGEERFGLPLSDCWGLAKRLGTTFDIINTRETFAVTSRQAVRHAEHSPRSRVVVSVFENIPFRYDDRPHLRRIKQEVRERADLFIANSPGAQRALELEGTPPERIRTIPPAIDTELFSPGPASADIRRSWGLSLDDRVVLYAGRLIPEKGLVELVTTLAPLLRNEGVAREDGTTRTTLVLQGTGGELGRIETAARALGVADRVVFAPWIETTRMPDVYRSADVVVLPSLPAPYWEEQFGYNLAEALACGAAIISTRTGAIPWVLGDAGVVVDPYDAAAWSAEVASLLEDSDRQADLRRRARAEAVRRYSVAAAGRDHVEAFSEALLSSPRSRS